MEIIFGDINSKKEKENKIMMKEMNIFEYATREALRFPYKGSQSVEDLWKLPVKELDDIYKDLNKEVKKSEEDSLLNTKDSVDIVLKVKIEIIKHIVSVKLEEAEIAKKAKENKEKEQKIMSILAARDDEALENASDEDLRKMLAEIRG